MLKLGLRCWTKASSSVKLPGSSRSSIRSRASSFPRACWRSTARGLPALTASARSRSTASRRSRVVCPAVRWALVMADLLGLTTAAAIAYLLTHGGIGFDPLLLALPAWGVLAGFYGLYKRDRVGADNATLDEVWPIFNCITVASFAVFAVVQAVWPSGLHGG